MLSEMPCFRQLACGEWAYCIEAFVLDGSNSEPNIGLFAILSKDIEAYARRGESTVIAQFDGLVKNGMVLTKHIFQGLRRKLRTDEDSDSDQRMLVHVRKPSYNYFVSNKRIMREDAPKATVFAVLVSPNIKHKDKYPEVHGWINTWTWLDEEPGLAEAPIGWVDRYDNKLWTRGG